jgi:SAM-dependent methyltransferase
VLPELSDDDLDRLRSRLTEVGYHVDGIVDLVGAPAHAALARNNTTPARRALAGVDDPVATLTRLWPLQATISDSEAEHALPGLVEPLQQAGMLRSGADGVTAVTDLRPYDADTGFSGWVFSDLTPGLDGPMRPIAADYVLGVSPASVTLAQLTIRRPARRVLDLGTGCGVQSLHLADHADQVIATDVNPRALAMARATARINQREIDIREGSLYEPVAGDRFDLIVTNPPYVMAPPDDDARRLAYREAGLPADELMRRVVVDGARHLAPGGSLQVLGNWGHPAESAAQSWRDRVAGWIAETGCDAHVLQREVLDTYSYIELWLADSGLAAVGGPEYRAAYDRWCAYFDRLGMSAVGMGWLLLTNTGRSEPQVTIEDWPHPVVQPIGPAWADRIDGVEVACRLSDAELLAKRWQLAPDVTQETVGRPGAADPQRIVLRQHRGFCRAVTATTELAAVVGACDGELALSQILGAVASIMGLETGPVQTAVLPQMRRLITDDLLTEGE